MLKAVLLGLLVVVPTATLGEDDNSQVSSFSGTWVGKWDNLWCVQFTVTEGSNVSGIDVTYTWLEQAPHPLRSLHRVGHRDGNRLRIEDPLIELFLSGTNNQAVAYGHFDQPRSAVLTREPTRRCEGSSPGA